MAKQKEERVIHTDPIELEPDSAFESCDKEETLNVPAQIARGLREVAVGGSPVDLRKLVVDLYPKDPEDAAKYVEMLHRMHKATELAVSTATGILR